MSICEWRSYAIDPKVDYSKEEPTLVEFRLQPTSTGTLLKVTESGFEKIPSARRAEAFLRNDGGWAQQMKNIQAHVIKNP
jgi:Activator of Hsp90 ATPase homolog 1-like protein